MRETIQRIRPDLVHLHGMWNWRIHVAASLCQELKIPYVFSPRGAISDWALAQSRLKKRVAMFVFQREDFVRAAGFHATALPEAGQLKKLGFGQPTITCPNGVNFPATLPAFSQRADGKRHLLFLSRIHKVKGLEDLVRAWSKVRTDGWVLDIVGNDRDGYWNVIAQEIQRLGLVNVAYHGLLEDDKKWLAYRSADCFVLPSYSENFGLVAAEALYAGLPAIVAKGAPWQDLEKAGAGWWIENGVAPLVAALNEMMSLSDEKRAEMGARGRQLVEEKYSWPSIGRQMREGYEWILGGVK